MKQAPCPRAVSVGKEQTQSQAIEQTQWPCFLPFLRHKAGWDSTVLASPTPSSLAFWLSGSLAACSPFSLLPGHSAD